jgi:DNA-binding transcriptional regulator YiaG
MVWGRHAFVKSVTKHANDSDLPMPVTFCHALGMGVSEAIRELEQLVLVRELAASGEARRIRQAAGLSQADLARACSVSAPAISRWEAGSRIPRGEAARRYAAIILGFAKRDGGP